MITIVKPSMFFEKTPVYISVSQETKPGLRYMDDIFTSRNIYRMSGFMGGEIASWIDSRINNKKGFSIQHLYTLATGLALRTS